ncbi:2-C-methyl-D-erythritol 4-phosphate cytidylyltransferase [Ruicaihuangia caeni]|uniref:Bifunctional enzyme IspD/IspF n=1 Tax=Ruicaihuangia caeni TaxID=3042517 RepID=A0AAW6TCI5_9MICO|nr:2-C-methyl-D-erythritol 4-phosphate cytidylyltransferase [Klugiella sp. YN-L-19]MDI2098747.1 2-C-methyl-D-erythritol 4-phosphate cytidylyltransferase [Klugiella sp. YN-L-19]
MVDTRARHPVSVIVVAAGSGTRLGAGVPKAFAEVAGEPMLTRALRAITGMRGEVRTVVVVPTQLLQTAADFALRAGLDRDSVAVVEGGATRQASVAAGLSAVDPASDVVLVHDAARALTPAAVFDRVVAEVRASGAGVVPALPVIDTIKRVDAGGRVLGQVDRSQLAAAQTPQGFPLMPLIDAYSAVDGEHTDDASLFAAAGRPVRTVQGDALAFKITTPADLARAEGVVAGNGEERMPELPRTGVGIDVHAYDEAAPLWLGALHWPGEVGLAGHSDGDAISHAICDALLSAASLGDLGSVFGTSDPALAGAHGDVFIGRTIALLADAGFRVGNVAVQVVARHPRVGTRREELQARLGALVGAPVSVSATTSDGLGFTGRGEGVTAVATALIVRVPAVLD